MTVSFCALFPLCCLIHGTPLSTSIPTSLCIQLLCIFSLKKNSQRLKNKYNLSSESAKHKFIPGVVVSGSFCF